MLTKIEDIVCSVIIRYWDIFFNFLSLIEILHLIYFD